MASIEAGLGAQRDAAARRVADRSVDRQRKVDAIRTPGGLATADDPERVATRIDRLSRYYADVRPINPAAIAAEEPGALKAAGAVLERIINTPDFVDARYLAGGEQAARAVGRVNVRDQQGRIRGYGTGSLVAPRLLLTNHHVLPDAVTAAASAIEFDYEDGLNGQPLQSKVIPFDPDSFFIADEQFDFALVAVAADEQALAAYGFNRLIPVEGKAIAGDFVTIVQHPRGEKKQVALRDNRVVDVFDLFVHYEADTEPGSSGSPVFNDQWELVALHHASVPAPEHSELGGIVNEGIRVSRLLAFLGGRTFPAAQQALVATLSVPERVAVAPPLVSSAPGAVAGASPEPKSPSLPGESAVTSGADVTVPLAISVRLGEPETPLSVAEAISIDPDYRTRRGYDATFLGTGDHVVPLPELPAELAALAAVNTMATGEPRYVLPYHHFSVVQHRERGLAFYTAVNIDGARSRRLKREKDRWVRDPRIGEHEQTGREVYADNDLDLGHLVRRLDPAWGDTPELAKLGNDDSFHLTNATPQHKDFNRNQTRWAGLEDYLLEHAENLQFRTSVFTGPVLAADDDRYRGVQLPRQFWKVAVMVRQDGQLSATGYLLSQAELIQGLEIAPEAFSYGAYRTYQVPIRQIEQLTRLSFGTLTNNDPLARQEALEPATEIERLDDIRL
jgi:endonuclease G